MAGCWAWAWGCLASRMNEQWLQYAVQNPFLSAAVLVLAVCKVIQVVMESQRHKSDKHSNKASLENLSAQTQLLKSLTESSTRQEGLLNAQTSVMANMSKDMAVAMDRQQAASGNLNAVRDALPGVCKFKPK